MAERVGAVVYVMGPSGSGKDTVLNHSRPRLEPLDVAVARRTITRPPGAGEDNVELSHGEFEAAVADGRFALWWEAHGNRYGIPVEIDDWLDRGRVVIVSGSRAHLRSAADRYRERLHPVLITAEPAVLARRLAGRAREQHDEQAARLARTDRLGVIDHARMVVIDNGGDLDEAVEAFVALVAALVDESTSPA